MKKIAMEGIITALMTTLVTLAVGGLFSEIFADNSKVIIGESTKVSDKDYYTPVTINTFNNEINGLEIGLPNSVGGNQIKTSEPVNITKTVFDLSNNDSSIYKLDNIPQDTNLQIALFSDSVIENEDISIHKNGNRIEVETLSEIQSPQMEMFSYIIASSILYGIYILVLTMWREKKRKEMFARIEEAAKRDMESIQEQKSYLERNMEYTNNQLKDTKEDLEKIDNFHKKQRLLTNAQLNDYSKELSFWRDTIRKVIYSSNSNSKEINANELINIVSKNLETYQTMENKTHDFEAIKALARILTEEKKNDKI
ncbi:hypothetical protein [Oceanobacillus jordanicus]|uniref:Uncharacterized protein n=1 Tax=Oceanobacillus jordanicus TaxID=2867266 RepID=A0AAW5B3J1_9BACI|nr:hypothetical protein [Oceanobacillus jordanicus]MCG3418951.1 hypothetical protein [Oceanobacillus jordanicus]